jgi:hypothetical protein
MGVGAGQQEFDRHDSGDMASGGRRQAGARFSAGGRQGGTSKKLIPKRRSLSALLAPSYDSRSC